jgi:dCTP deaminase
MILNRGGLLLAQPILGMVPSKQVSQGFSWGLTECGYDIRIRQDVWLFLGRRFVLASSMEEFKMPDNLMGRVLNKSTWARLGVDASMTTNIEPGWEGFLTIELRYSRIRPLHIPAGVGIAQVIFETLSEPASYRGKYQNQGSKPVPAITTRELV